MAFATSNGVDVTVAVVAGVSADTLRRWSMTARRRLPARRGRVSVVTVSPQVSRRLNRTYRGLDRPTNVLSFGPGEIILCPAVIRREARQQVRPYRSYLQFILHHGFIHLLGLDHRTAVEQQRWRRLERHLTNS